MGDGAARHLSTLRGIDPCRVMTFHKKSLKFQLFSIPPVKTTFSYNIFKAFFRPLKRSLIQLLRPKAAAQSALLS